MYNCLQGHPPVKADTWMLTAINKLYEQVIPFRPEGEKSLPSKLKEIILKSLSVDPSYRQSSMSELKQQVESCMAAT
jgi:serine/threonine protein kinase